MFSFLSGNAKKKKIASVEQSGSWVYIYDLKGERIKTLSTNQVGIVQGFASDYFVSKYANWIYLYDVEGRRYKTLTASQVGDIISVSEDCFMSRFGTNIYTYDKKGTRIRIRAAR